MDRRKADELLACFFLTVAEDGEPLEAHKQAAEVLLSRLKAL